MPRECHVPGILVLNTGSKPDHGSTLMPARKWTLHRIHKWLGLVAASWLLVLGLTGFLLDHRDTWRWLWQDGVSANWVNAEVKDKSESGQVRLYQLNPLHPEQQVSGGLTGMWWSENAGKNWQATRFERTEIAPMVYALVFTPAGDVWIASDDGLWLSKDQGKTARQHLLAGKWISTITINEKQQQLSGVIARSKIFHYDLKSGDLNWPALQPVDSAILPDSVNLSRFTRDLHYGRGVFTIWLSLLWNDVSAIAMVVIPVTGLLFYFLPLKWKRNKRQNKMVSPHYKKQLVRWLFRLHAPLSGLIASLPILYLSLSGILLDHSTALRSWMKSVDITRQWQTPVYSLASWEGEIYGLVTARDKPTGFSIGTRLGLFSTEDNGRHWQRELLPGPVSFFVWTLRQQQDAIFIGGMGGPNLVKQGKRSWHAVKAAGHMPSDITSSGSQWIWKSHHGLVAGNPKTGFRHHQLRLPGTTYIPWFYVIDALHSGVLIHSQWKWVNDFIAVLAVILVLTGLIRWWRKKWI